MQVWAPLSHLLCNPADEDVYQLLGRRASHTLTDYNVSFSLKEDKNTSAKPKVSDTPTPRYTGDSLRSTSITQNTCGTALWKHRHPQVT